MTGGWAAGACALPAAERPSREAEFDALFARAVRGAERIGPDRLRLDLDPAPGTAGRAAELVARETRCCSFFTFVLTAGAGRVSLEIGVPAAHTPVLDALAVRAAGGPA
ncbi:hypothetical protein D5H75_01180 [Bailinhaonella thermotolerans]|uniref:Arsenate reductase n=2 Tax=Bailinhaonella thermotolerans TaxID=1070861 RepID=A0A3A4AYM5_9ACTN|nr:hypothetical protein D5H75_01180 [Bailinhaonella thermotolerans]